MADVDSSGASNRQSPTSVRVNKPPSRVVIKQPRSKIQISPTVRKKKVVRSGGTTNYRNKEVSNRATKSGNIKSSTPTPVAPSNTKTIVPPAPPKPVPPKMSDYLRSDSTYQRQAAAYAKALADFQADQGLAKTDYNTGFQTTSRDIGLAKADAQKNLQNDFASRGMLQSSLYNQGLGELNTQYQNQSNDLNKQQTSYLEQLAQELMKFKNEQSTQLQNAQAEAVRRRAEKYGL